MEYLKFKAKRKKAHESTIVFLRSEFNESDAFFLCYDMVQSIKLKISHSGIESPSHHGFNNHAEYDWDFLKCQNLRNIHPPKNKNNDDWVFLFPAAWAIRGGIAIRESSFLRQFVKVSEHVDDDFDLYDQNLNSSLKFRGDRSGGILAYAHVEFHGNKFGFLK